MANFERVPSHGPRKDLAADALLPPTTRERRREARENNFRQLHTSWLTLLGGFLLWYEAQTWPGAYSV